MKIKSKEDALLFLDNLIQDCHEIMIFLPHHEAQLYILTIEQLNAMKNSINHSQDFFKRFFENKSGKEIKQWIESEAKKW